MESTDKDVDIVIKISIFNSYMHSPLVVPDLPGFHLSQEIHN